MNESPKSLIPYDDMVMNALRAVVREAIQRVSDKGLPGDHHYYLTFRTDHPAAEMPAAIKTKYPTEIRIALQYQFSNLYVDDFGFHVTLYFGGMPTPFYVPFDAITSFLDPHVQFSIRFEPLGLENPIKDTDKPREHAAAAKDSTHTEDEQDKASDNVVSLSSFRKS